MRILMKFFLIAFLANALYADICIKDFKPIVEKIIQNKLENATLENLEYEEPKEDSIMFENSPYIEFINMVKRYQKEHLDFELERFAKNDETRDFVNNYLKYHRLLIADFIVRCHIKKDCDCNEVKNFLEGFALQKDFIKKQDSDFFVDFANLQFQKPCIGGPCGHVNEIFVINNTLGYFKDSKDYKKLEKVAAFGFKAYDSYVLLTQDRLMVLNDNLFDVKSLIALKPSKRQIEAFLDEFRIDENQLFQKVQNFFIADALNYLYATNYMLHIIANKQYSAKSLYKEAKEGGIYLCNFPFLNDLNKEILEICESENF